jgi:hypothetical protein
MNTSLTTQSKIQQFMIATGMIYSVVQIAALLFSAICLLPVVGPPDGQLEVSFKAHAVYADLFRLANYLMLPPVIFFLLFLGGLYTYFDALVEKAQGISMVAVLSGTAFVMIWPMGAIISLLGVNMAEQGGDMITATALDAMPPYSLALSCIPRVAFLVCTSALLTDHKWLARTGFILAALSLVGSMTFLAFPFFGVSMASTLLFHIWVFCLSFTLRHQQQKRKLSTQLVEAYN